MSDAPGPTDGSTPPSREKRSIRLELLGRGFVVRSDDDEAYVRELADFVNKKLHEIRTATNRIEVDQIALLAALDIADTLFRERHRTAALRREVRERSRQLLGAIDAMAAAIGGAVAANPARKRASGHVAGP